MSNKIETKYGSVTIEKADQTGPYRLYRKFFKSKAHRTMIEKFGKIVRKYYPNYSEKDVAELYGTLSEKGCSYATMANILMEQLGNDDRTFQEHFGYSLGNSDGSINYNMLMVDIYACIANMIELNVYKYDRRKFSDYIEAANVLLGGNYIDKRQAINDLNKVGWLGDGVDENGMLIFLNNKQFVSNTFIGNYRDIAKELFGIDNVNISKEQLEGLLKQNNFGYKFNFLQAPSKFSGLANGRISNLKKWMNKYFEVNNADLALEAEDIKSYNINCGSFIEIIKAKMAEGYSFDVSAHDEEVWMQNGKDYDKPASENSGHAMSFEGFDANEDFLVCSWGKNYTIAKEYYDKLEFTAIKIASSNKDRKRGM